MKLFLSDVRVVETFVVTGCNVWPAEVPCVEPIPVFKLMPRFSPAAENILNLVKQSILSGTQSSIPEAPNNLAMKRNIQECETLCFKRTGCHGRSLGQPVQIAGNKEHEGAPIHWWGEKDLITPGFVEHLEINKLTGKRCLNWIKPKSAQPSLVEYNLWGMTHCVQRNVFFEY